MNKYEEVMSRKNQIMIKSVGMDFDKYEKGIHLEVLKIEEHLYLCMMLRKEAIRV